MARGMALNESQPQVCLKDLWLVGFFRVCPSPIALEVLLG